MPINLMPLIDYTFHHICVVGSLCYWYGVCWRHLVMRFGIHPIGPFHWGQSLLLRQSPPHGILVGPVVICMRGYVLDGAMAHGTDRERDKRIPPADQPTATLLNTRCSLTTPVLDALFFHCCGVVVPSYFFFHRRVVSIHVQLYFI